MTTDENGSSNEKEVHGLAHLLESTYPLLKEFRDKCAGTFKHSQAVGGFAEGVSVALGLDSTYMKVGALYHDIGKMRNPKYYTENQLEDENMHDDLDPYISYLIISNHVASTAHILLSDENFPRDLIKIATQHHGTNIMKYFFDKSESDDENRFRYKGSKPQCVESMILMICDCIEARSRSDIQSGKFDPLAVIEETINDLMKDGQLDDVTMKLGDLQIIKEALAKELEGTYQKRVDYSKAKEEGQNKKEKEQE